MDPVAVFKNFHGIPATDQVFLPSFRPLSLLLEGSKSRRRDARQPEIDRVHSGGRNYRLYLKDKRDGLPMLLPRPARVNDGETGNPPSPGRVQNGKKSIAVVTGLHRVLPLKIRAHALHQREQWGFPLCRCIQGEAITIISLNIFEV